MQSTVTEYFHNKTESIKTYRTGNKIIIQYGERGNGGISTDGKDMTGVVGWCFGGYLK